MLSGSVGRDFVVENVLADLGESVFHAGGVVETVAEAILDCLAQDAEILLLTFVVEIAIGFGESDVLHHTVPEFGYTCVGVG